MIALWIAYAFMISALLSGVALGTERALRLYGRSARWVWAVVIAAGIATPLTIRFAPVLFDQAEAASVAPAAPSFGPVLLDPLVMAFTRPAPSLERLDTPLMGLWALMTLALLGLLTGGAVRLARQRKAWTRRPLEGDPVLISENFGPALVGLRRPEIVLPEWTLEMAPGDLHLVMLHEREHQKARDTHLLTAGLFALLAMPWNVPLWWQFRRLRAAVEVDCDARVLSGGVSGAEYGALLLRMGQRIGGMGLAAAAMTEPKSLLEGRIKMITQGKPRGRFARAAVALGLAVTILAVACETPTPSVVQDELEEVAALATEEASARTETIKITGPVSSDDGPLVIIDGERVENANLSDLDPDAIERIEVLKGSAAIEAYGEAAGHGVIQIFLKEPNITDGPAFTPMTVRPELTNRDAVIRAMEQEYPRDLRDAGVGGRVVVWWFITETGEVADTRISQTSGHAALDDAALRVADVFEFKPALNRDEPVPVWVQFPITFEVR